MAFSVCMAPCFQALSGEELRRMLRPATGSAASTVPSLVAVSSIFGERLRIGQGSARFFVCVPSQPNDGRGVCRCSSAQAPRDAVVDGLLMREGWLSKSSEVPPSWNSDLPRRGVDFQSSAVSTADYTVAQDELRHSGDGRSSGRGSQRLSPYIRNDESENGSDAGDLFLVDSQMQKNEDDAIAKLGVDKSIVDALAKRGITHLFPIQKAVFKPAMEGKNLIARAKTGTGKTLAFAIPIIHQILKEKLDGRMARVFGRTPRALILAPTRELAKQVEKEFMESAPTLSTLCVYGGVSITAQQRQLARGVDVAVGTPGRIIDLIDRGSLNLTTVQYMVLDEADQMLAVGFEEDVEKIMEQLQEGYQSMLFSATMPGWVKKITRKFMRDAITIDLVGESDEKLAEGIKLYSISTISAAKRGILNDLIMVYGRGGKSIVFTQTKKDADEVAQALSRLVGCEALHGDISQNRRESIMKSFREGRFSVLVATDVAARGLDISDVDLIIHYEIPNDPETFVHRSGRTGRAGKEGTAILMHTQQERRTLLRIEQDVGCKFERIDPPHVTDVLRSSSAHATSAISKVHPELKKQFLPAAEKLLEEKGIDAFAAAIAHISGFSQPPVSRSLITHEEGMTTLRIIRSGRGGPPLASARSVMGTLGEVYPAASQNMGKILMIDEPDVEGAVFDLPEDIARELLTKKLAPCDTIDVPSKLPSIQDEFSGRSSAYGKFSSRVGFSGGRGYQDFEGRGYGRRSFDRARDDTFGYRGRARSRDDDQFDRTFSRSVDRPGSGGGACYICGQVGHFAAGCPQRRR